MDYHISTQWLSGGCYLTIGDGRGSMTVCVVLRTTEQIEALVDALIVAANSKPEEMTDAE